MNIIKKSHRQLAVSILLLLSLISFGLYLALFRLGLNLPIAIFWSSVISFLATFTLCVQVFEYEKLKGFLIVTLIIFLWLIKTLFVPVTVPFFGSDAYVSSSATTVIEETGWFSTPPWDLGENIEEYSWIQERNYPFLAGVSIAISKVSSLSIENWSRWGMLLVSLFSILLIFGISYKIYESKKTALLSAIGFGFTYNFLMFHSLYVRETIAFLLFLATIYSLLEVERADKLQAKIVPLFFAFALVFAHHLTTLLFVCFLLLFLIVSTLTLYFNRTENHRLVKTVNWSFLGFLLVAMLTYWVYLQYSPFRIVNVMVEDAVSDNVPVSLTSAVPPSWRYILTLRLQMIASVIIGVLAFVGVFKYRISKITWQITSIIWGGGLGISALLGIIGALGPLGSFPSRMEIFGYVFLIPAAAHTITKLQYNRKLLGTSIGILVILIHGGASILRISPYLYSNISPNFEVGETRASLLRDEYDLIKKVKSDKLGFIGTSFRGPVVQNKSSGVFWKPSFVLEDYDVKYFVVTQLDLYFHTILTEDLLNQKLDKVYDTGHTEIFVPRLRNESWNINSVLNEEVSTKENDFSNFALLFFQWLALAVLLIVITSLGTTVIQTMIKRDEKDYYQNIGRYAIGFCFGTVTLFLSFLLYDVFGGRQIILLVAPSFLTLLVLFAYNKSIWSVITNLFSFSSAIILCVVFMIFLFSQISLNSKREPYSEFLISKLSSDKREGEVLIINKNFSAEIYQVIGWVGNEVFINMTDIYVEPGQTQSMKFSIDHGTIEKIDSESIVGFVLKTTTDPTKMQTLGVWLSP